MKEIAVLTGYWEAGALNVYHFIFMNVATPPHQYSCYAPKQKEHAILRLT